MTGLHSCAIGALILTAATAAYSQVHYTIKGELPEAEGLTVYMIDYDNNATIDSAAVKNGNFILQGDYNRDAYVRINAGREYSNCILDSLVTIDFNTHIAKPGTSTINDTLKQYLDMEEEYFSRGMALRDSCLSAGMSETEAGQYFHDNYYLNESPKLQEKIRKGLISNQNGAGEALLFTYLHNDLTPDEWDSVYSELSPRLLEYNLTKKTNNKFENLRKTMPGQPFIDFSGKTVDGKEIKLSDFVGKGKYVLVDFWASWCGPCRQESKQTIKPLYEKYKDNEKFMILGVAVWDKPDATIKALEKDGYQWPQMIDAGMTPMKLYGYDGIPQIILFNPDGTIAQRNLRGTSLLQTVESALH